MPRLSPDDHAALNLLAGGRLYRTTDRRFYQRQNAQPVTAARIDHLAEEGLVSIYDFTNGGRRITAARLTKDGREARSKEPRK